jgi:hypothetical protein
VPKGCFRGHGSAHPRASSVRKRPEGELTLDLNSREAVAAVEMPY